MKQDAGTGSPYSTPGHYYSPLYTPNQMRAYQGSSLFAAQAERVDAMLDLPAMRRTWSKIAPHIVNFPFQRTKGFRYFGDNRFFEYIDAATLSGMLGWLRPKRVIEIGAGFSSAVMFDTFDRLENNRLEHFCTIDPDLSRVKDLDPPENAELCESLIQTVETERFDALEKGDILFIDSSHVMKTASDVHYIYLHLLPRLKPGVVVHIHDIFYPFEYPRRWRIREPRFWNEAHIVDTMLTHGNSFDILFFVDAFVKKSAPALKSNREVFDRFDGFDKRQWHHWNGSLWLRKT
ncbi:class I SAM-dependent methyltransferase [Aestuariivita boseongensis]|uniref:class I SAM-dependent methyltransferase n=1 Tax=Aestuariivita boseongensis TaxID=1470562 RepID=UPI00068354FF|nr:class I SAM-dependent methyltransferase [Aestuariivita boseongensis]